MTKSFDDIMAQLPQDERQAVNERGQQLLEEYMTLQQLRKAQALTQKSLAEKLNVNQENISRLEKRTDMMLSTLRDYVEAMGGELNITVTFPDHKTISLANLSSNQAVTHK